jgi:ligand-binding sensor domain-containing protein/signal transduction histidine kinase/DNA-binding response OmpR family regulator
MLKFITGILCYMLTCLSAQSQQILFRNYSVKDGLCSNTIWNIEQDEKGYMWFGTKNGLNRFNGYEFKTYQFSKEDTNSIGNNFIHAICQYDSKTFWLGTDDGIYVLNLENEQFHHLPIAGNDLVFDIMRDSKGVMWVGSGKTGVYSYNPVDRKINNFKATPGTKNALSQNQVRTLAEDEQGRIWIGTFGEGIDVLDPSSMQFRHFKNGNAEVDLNSNRIMTLYKDVEGNIWAGSLGGLYVWMKDTDTFRSYHKGGAGSLNENIVRALYQPSPDKLYVGTEKGLNILDLPSDTFTAFTHKNNDPRSISDNAVYSIFPDKEGGIWVGTFFGGVNYFPQKGSGFELYYATGERNSISGNAVSCFLEDKPGYFYIGTENAGLNYFDSHTKTFKTYPFTPSQQPLSYHNIHSLLKDKSGNIWIGTFSAGLNIFNPGTGKVRKYLFNKSDSNSISNNNIYSLYEDREGSIWVGTTKGLNVYDPSKDQFRRINEMGLQYNIIYRIIEDENNNIWFLTYDKGLVTKNQKTGKWARYIADGKPNSLSSMKIISVLDDEEGNLWLGTDGGGLNRFNKESRTFTVFGEQQGVSPVIYGIEKDDHGDLWLSTNGGIIKFSPQKQMSLVYSNLDDLQSNQFNYNAALKSSDGKMYFGGINGFNAFYPDSLIEPRIPGSISLTNFQLFNKDVKVDSADGPLKKLIGFADQIELTHDQSVLSFEYAAMSYMAPGKIQYAYIMDGFDKTWNYVDGQRKATYRNLPPGTYTFKVKSTDISGNWKERTADIKVIVKPPFYRTTIAYIVYLMLLLIGVSILRSFSARAAKKKNEIKLERLKVQREQEFYNQKMEFFTSMAHEIRTPLSLIIAPLERLISAEDWKPAIREQLTIMDENSDRLLSLVNQLLDFRRIESDIYTIRTEEVELISFIHTLYSRFSAISFQKGIRFTMATSINRLVVQADPEAITKILTNLLINAFKFAKSKVEVRINDVLKQEGGQQFFSISVVDDGNGIPAEQLENIFKAFFKISTNGRYDNVGGTGIGLALAKSLSEKHNGKLLVESIEQVQTIFTLLIPHELPVVVKAPPELIAPDANPGNPDEDLPVILVVEDDSSLLEFISKSLRSEHYKAYCANNGVEAIALLESHPVELIISDVMMPGMDGIEFCRQVKTNISYSHIPLILLTAKGNSDSEIEGLESGADAYMIKPFKWKHVTVVIKNLLESRLRLKNKFTQQPLVDVGTLSTNTHDKKFMEEIVSIIEGRITDPQLSVEELSREMNMSRSSLHKKLKAMAGHVPNEFIRLIRLRNAATMLLSGEHNISEVGYKVGFSSHSYFSKCFAQQFNETPSEFVEKHQPHKTEQIHNLNIRDNS